MKNKSKQSLSVFMISILVAIVSVMISLFAFIDLSIKMQAEANDILAIYEKTDYEYILKNPSNNQIAEFAKNSSIKKVIPYYQIVYTFKIANKDIELNLKSIDDLQDLNFTEFAEKRLIEKKEVSGNEIYLDYSLSAKFSLKLGDIIGSNVMEFVVAGFYQNYDAQLAFVPNLKNIIGSKLTYTGVYVDVDNIADFNTSIVENYKPMATLKEREAFSDDEAYQAYLNDFNNRDYSAYIVDKSTGYEVAKESFENKICEAKSLYMTAGIVAGVIVLLGLISLSLLFAKNVKYEVVDGGRKTVISRYVYGSMLSLIGVVVTWVIGVDSAIASQLHFINLLNVLSLGWTSLLIPIIGVIMGMIINIAIVRGYKEKRK